MQFQEVIKQEMDKYKLEETKVNLYGEAAGAKYYYPPVLLACLISHQPQEYPDDEFGVIRSPFYKKMWFWVVVGGAVVGTTTALVLLNQPSETDAVVDISWQ